MLLLLISVLEDDVGRFWGSLIGGGDVEWKVWGVYGMVGGCFWGCCWWERVGGVVFLM